jgi:peroxiredoxin (alkyl hydroperoxide reductase subunit C)
MPSAPTKSSSWGCAPAAERGGPANALAGRRDGRILLMETLFRSAAMLVTTPAPDFTAQAVMPDNDVRELKLSAYRGKYVVLFFYPLDFTFVCPTELIAFDRALPKFRERGCEVLSVSVDSAYTHLAWKNTPLRQGGVGPVQYPMIADLDKRISRAYDVLLNDSVALRGLFLIDRDGIIRHAVVNDLPLGRNVDEVLRMLDALQFFERHGDVCPANWKKGEDGMAPNAKGVAKYLAEHA